MTAQTATTEPTDSTDSPTDEHADCYDFRDREAERKWASADAVHVGALAAHALSAACQVLHFGALVEVEPTSVADQAKVVADELLHWLLEHNPPPSQLRDRIDEELPQLENPHPDAGQGWLANALGGVGPSAASGPAPGDGAGGSGDGRGGVYL